MIYLILASMVLVLIPLNKVLAVAVCPVCTVAAGAALGLSRYLGVDDTITGVWIGALMVSLVVLTIRWLDKKKIKFYFRKILVVLIYYLSLIIPLYKLDFVGIKNNTFCGIDKLIFGILAGTFGIWIGAFMHKELKKKNNDKVYFPFQPVVVAILPLIIFSVILYFATK
ncbi:MAG: hypothetical protein GF347_03355 [Candidatus Moranbacteria bacterium]|nr:hypothetical protein [Candidatus Moranbacteria bacterium]